jgi:hypothetical protein
MTFVCVACRAPLFAATSLLVDDNNNTNNNNIDNENDSILNFSASRPSATHAQPDHSFGLPRTKLSCAKCDVHLGHVFHAPTQLPDRVRFCVSAAACELQTAPLSASQLAPVPNATSNSSSNSGSNANVATSSSLPSNANVSANKSSSSGSSLPPGAATAANVVAGMTQQAVAAKARRDEAQHSASTVMAGAAALALVGVALVYLFRKSK